MGSTDGFVEGNFVASTGAGGISLAQLAAIRRIGGVAVAAPIGMVGMLRYHTDNPLVHVPDDPDTGQSVAPVQPTLYKLTWTLGLGGIGGTRTVQSGSGHIVLRRQAKGQDYSRLVVNGDGPASSAGASPDGIDFDLSPIPSFSSAIIAVDPAAEAALLGPRDAVFAPLQQFPSGPRTAAAIGPLLRNAPWSRLPAAWRDEQHWIFDAASGADTAGKDKPVVPLLVNTTPAADLTYSLTVQRAAITVGAFPDSAKQVSALADQARTYTMVGTSTLDLSKRLEPFTSPYINVPWPGTVAPQGWQASGPAADLAPVLIGRPSYSPAQPLTTDGTPSFRVAPKGLVQIDGRTAVDMRDPASRLAGTQAYRTATPTGGPGLADSFALPIGGFDAAALPTDTGQISYVPFGAYDPAKTTLIADPAGHRLAPIPVPASPSGLDFISPLPGAITDLAGASVLRGDTPIDAVRVRVGGIGSYNRQSQQRVADIAQAIGAMGLHTTVVAGSSPQPVNIYVPDYRISPAGAISDLGWARQDWTTLGAAATVSTAMAGLSWWLLTLALAAAAALQITITAVGGRARAAQATVLRTQGWPARRIRRWHLAEQLPTVIVVAVAGAACLLLTGAHRPTVTAAVASLAIVVMGTLAAARTSRTSVRPAARGRSHRITAIARPSAVALRQVRRHPLGTAAQAGAMVLLALAAVGGYLSMTAARERSGATRLAGYAWSVTDVGNLTLAGTGLLAAVTLAVLAQRVTLRQRRKQWTTLRAAGWTRPDIRRVTITETAIATIPALMIATLLAAAAAAAGTVATPDALTAAGIAAGTVVLAAVIIHTATRWST